MVWMQHIHIRCGGWQKPLHNLIHIFLWVWLVLMAWSLIDVVDCLDYLIDSLALVLMGFSLFIIPLSNMQTYIPNMGEDALTTYLHIPSPIHNLEK